MRQSQFDLEDVDGAILVGRSPEAVEIRAISGEQIGVLDARYSRILHVLLAEEDVDIQISLGSKSNQNSSGSAWLRPKKHNTKSQSRSEPLSLSINLYGTEATFEDVGHFLSQCSEYLQSPVHCDRNVPYRNPQSLSDRAENPVMTFELQPGLSLSEIETLAQSADPSAVFETKSVFPETEPLAAIRTHLYRYMTELSIPTSRRRLTLASHQKQALTFMLMRERGRQPNEIVCDDWRSIRNEDNDSLLYVTMFQIK